MSHEQFHEPGERLLLPVSKKALEQAFPYSTNKGNIDNLLRKEALAIAANNQDFLIHMQDLRTAYPGNSTMSFNVFSDGIKFMHRILRNHTTLPNLSPNLLTVYDVEHRRAITDRGKGAREYFVNKWVAEVQRKPENGPLAHTLEKVAGYWTPKIEEIWGGAYYVTRVFERQIKVNEANKAVHPDIKQIFPS